MSFKTKKMNDLFIDCFVKTFDVSSLQFNALTQSCSREGCLRLLVDVAPLCAAPNCSLFATNSQIYSNFTQAVCAASEALENCSAEADEGQVSLERHFKAIKQDRSRLVDTNHFAAFLPPDPIGVGDTYPIIDKIDDGPSPFFEAIPRFDSYVDPRHRALAAILNHFQDDGSVLLYPTSQPRCSHGVVRAKNMHYMSVQFW